ncbi:uncharacterized protein LOC120354966 [Nilaparvata lugens]|uniref:uncharacterized protein LOC120354966 n=1 Tax=Nilaparvata lugens TaxID=108931 RepID=UPI00193DA738|nr:uncharacterized protein LOC120354966 [Nilaparvata lugens]
MVEAASHKIFDLFPALRTRWDRDVVATSSLPTPKTQANTAGAEVPLPSTSATASSKMDISEVLTEDEDALLEGGGGDYTILPAYGTPKEVTEPPVPSCTKKQPTGFRRGVSQRLEEQLPLSHAASS